VPEVLDKLRELGCKIVLCSNGIVEYEELVTKATGIRSKFDLLISGSDYASKVEAVSVVMSQLPSMLNIVVGDRKHDIDAGVGNGIISVAALYGYTRPNELDAATYSINAPIELISIVEGLLNEASI
jgi:phosphoglycolate phosphatase